MSRNALYRKICFFMVFLISIPLSLYSFTDQITSERILRENKNFVHFIDVCISNFSQNKTDEFRKAYSLHFNADVAYLQSEYRRTYKKIYASQEILCTLYAEMVRDVYLEDSKNLLDTVAPLVIRSKNQRARHFLTLGYRDRTICWTHNTIGDASNPRLYSFKIYQYQKAIKYARRAKRYAFLALFECQTREMKKKIFLHLLKSENQKGNLFFGRFADLSEADYIKEMSKNYSEYEKEHREQKVSDAKQVGEAFENKVEKRVRFRSEKRAARYLINTEFDPAEDIMRKYIENFNFKLIDSALEVLSSNAPQSEAEKVGARKVDFNSFKPHLIDNYARYISSSVLESFYGKLTVEDKVDSERLKKVEEEEQEQPAKDAKESEAASAKEQKSEVK